ncbi:MAG: 3'-5' exonuclease [Proteiniphilum sp.]|nr:3'-5' exonuclease domain-containing protein 2 [Proteiniphilum sp.]NCD14516.1 3'-5' exonuclease domain-containing protein 2 [Bacteroidia bacterium]HHT35067.1 3'-5' exonuclease domain-containing protein 2 [Bacteroidales bacterium]MDD2726001.1 3'-5' exonuclease domain-containing protein 2 [Proteiniphilum sp.]MDD3332119.1 3'-5' exonuclease domain-containing protein 2 [Proteiniphilum sp.]
MGLTITKEQLSGLPIETFAGKIIVIDHEEEVSDAVAFLSQQAALGFDTETKPSFKRGQNHKVALMQLATDEVCYLFRLNRIGYPDKLVQLMSNPDIKKIGLSLRDDFAAIRQRSVRKPENFIDLQLFVDKFGIDDNSLQKIYALLFGRKISKSQRLSNWETSQLTPAQQSYAAIDAWACLRIYNHLSSTNNEITPYNVPRD